MQLPRSSLAVCRFSHISIHKHTLNARPKSLLAHLPSTALLTPLLLVLPLRPSTTLLDLFSHPEIAAVINALAGERWSHFQSQLIRLAPHQVQVESLSSYSEEQLTSFRQIFYAHSDGKGHINVEQLARLLNKVINTGYEVTQDEARDFMKKVRPISRYFHPMFPTNCHALKPRSPFPNR